MIDAKPSGSSRKDKAKSEPRPVLAGRGHHIIPSRESRIRHDSEPGAKQAQVDPAMIVRLTVLVVVAFGIPDGHAATPDPVAESITHQSSRSAASQQPHRHPYRRTLPLADDKARNRPISTYVAYTRDEAASGSRPITFVFQWRTGLQLGLSSSWRAGTAGHRFRVRWPGPSASRHGW